MSELDFDSGSVHRFGGSSNGSYHDGDGDSLSGDVRAPTPSSSSTAASRGLMSTIGARSGIALPTIAPSTSSGTAYFKRIKTTNRSPQTDSTEVISFNGGRVAGRQEQLASTLKSASTKSFAAPMPLRPLIEGLDHTMTPEELWEDLRQNVTRYIFATADAQQAKIREGSRTASSNSRMKRSLGGEGFNNGLETTNEVAVPYAMAKLVTYAKYGPAVEDPRGVTVSTRDNSCTQPSALRLRGSQSLLLKHEEAALIREEIRSIIVDIYMLKKKKKRGEGKQDLIVQGDTFGRSQRKGLLEDDGGGAPRRLSMKALSSMPPTGGVPSSVSEPSQYRRVPPSSAPATTSGTGKISAPVVPPSTDVEKATTVNSKIRGGKPQTTTLLNTLINAKTGTPAGLAGSFSPSSSALASPNAFSSMRSAVAAPNVKASSVPDSVYGLEMLDQQHPMAHHVLELSRLELKHLLDACERTLPRCEKDGSKVSRSTLVDHLADAIFAERDKRIMALKRADAKLEDVRTDTLLTKRKAITIYNKTHPPACSISSLDKPSHVQRVLHRRAFLVADIAEKNNPSVAQNVRIVRDEFRIEPGTVAEGWDGYCCIRNKKYGGGPTSGRPDVV